MHTAYTNTYITQCRMSYVSRQRQLGASVWFVCVERHGEQIFPHLLLRALLGRSSSKFTPSPRSGIKFRSPYPREHPVYWIKSRNRDDIDGVRETNVISSSTEDACENANSSFELDELFFRKCKENLQPLLINPSVAPSRERITVCCLSINCDFDVMRGNLGACTVASIIENKIANEPIRSRIQ